ncbi:MAG TPA: potassium channel family protein [Candidatus Limnocylindria bacterium]|nr:potassium channel family protein [Candidatus Limnocylindria bacterium]
MSGTARPSEGAEPNARPADSQPSSQRIERRWGSFYLSFLRDLRDNLVVALPLVVLFVLLVMPGSATLLCLAECGSDFGDWWTALWVTWQAMTTMGFDHVAPATPAGRVIAALDALIGYALLGVLVFIIARSAEREGRLHRD